MPLPLASSRTSSALPTPEGVSNSIQVATTAEAAHFLLERFTDRTEAAGKRNESDSLIAHITKYAQNLERIEQNDSKAWVKNVDEIAENTDAEFQQALAEYAAEHTPEDLVTCQWAISEDSRLLRRYADRSNTAPDQDTVENLDTMLNAHLMDKGLINREGVIYRRSGNEPLRDSQGNPIRAPTQDIRTAMYGLPTYLAENKSPVTLQMNNVPFPGQAAPEASAS